MAIVIPAPPSAGEAHTEHNLLTALSRALPDTCAVYQSLAPTELDRRGQQDCPSHCIVVMATGVVVLEVVRKLDQAGASAPFRETFELAERLRRGIARRRWNEAAHTEQNAPLGFPVGYAVLFLEPSMAAAAPKRIPAVAILTSEQLPRLEYHLSRVLNAWRQPGDHTPTEPELRWVRAAAAAELQLVRAPTDPGARFVRLSSDQAACLEALSKRRRARVEGVAGTGKTLVALAFAQRLASTGRSTLLCCYNPQLAGRMQKALGHSTPNLTVCDYQTLCEDWCRAANVPLSPHDGDSGPSWQIAASDGLMQAIEHRPNRFDAVVVDEGEDFAPSCWLPLELINRDGERGTMVVFADSTQWQTAGDRAPRLGKPLQLSTNHRSTRHIAELLGELGETPTEPRERASGGRPPIDASAGDLESQRRLVKAQIDEWLAAGMSPSQISVLSPLPLSSTAFSSLLDGIPTTSDLDEWQRDSGVLTSTVGAFKGLESDAVLLLDVAPPGCETLSDYVGASRARLQIALQRRTDSHGEI